MAPLSTPTPSPYLSSSFKRQEACALSCLSSTDHGSCADAACLCASSSWGQSVLVRLALPRSNLIPLLTSSFFFEQTCIQTTCESQPSLDSAYTQLQAYCQAVVRRLLSQSHPWRPISDKTALDLAGRHLHFRRTDLPRLGHINTRCNLLRIGNSPQGSCHLGSGRFSLCCCFFPSGVDNPHYLRRRASYSSLTHTLSFPLTSVFYLLLQMAGVCSLLFVIALIIGYLGIKERLRKQARANQSTKPSNWTGGQIASDRTGTELKSGGRMGKRGGRGDVGVHSSVYGADTSQFDTAGYADLELEDRRAQGVFPFLLLRCSLLSTGR